VKHSSLWQGTSFRDLGDLRSSVTPESIDLSAILAAINFPSFLHRSRIGSATPVLLVCYPEEESITLLESDLPKW
jgi:hypothetical protein